MKERTGDYIDSIIYDINMLTNYYKEKGLTIIGLNDSQGVNVTSTFFKKGLLEYIASMLKSDDLDPKVINAFSLLMNKTEHIDYFLDNNLSLEEIKLSQVYSYVEAIKKVMSDIHLPEALGNVGYVSKLVYRQNSNDNNIHIATSLRLAKEPTVIYSSGVNNLMREVGNNPFAIKKDYQNRNITPNYDYTVEKAKNPATLDTVLNGIDKNFENILSINGNTDIYTLGAYEPKSFESEGMNVFRDLVCQYNERLERLCKRYNITFINTEEIGKKYNQSEMNFHISSQGHNALANYILEKMYERKIENPTSCIKVDQKKRINLTREGATGIISKVNIDYSAAILRSCELSGYAKLRELEQAKEHEREKEVFEKVYKKINR